MAFSSGVDVKTLSSMLGHFSAGFTLDTYTHITNEMQRGAAEKIGGFMETATAKPDPRAARPAGGERCKVIPFEKGGVRAAIQNGAICFRRIAPFLSNNRPGPKSCRLLKGTQLHPSHIKNTSS